MIMLALAFLMQDAYDIPQDVPPPVAAPQSGPVDKHARKGLRQGLERMGEMFETLGRCTGSMSIEEVQALLVGARDQGPAGEYLTSRFEAGLRKPVDDDAWCHKTVGKLSDRMTRP